MSKEKNKQTRTTDSSAGLLADFKRLGRLWPYTKGNRKLVWVPVVTIPLTALVQIGQPLLIKYGIDEGILAKDDSVIYLAATGFFALVLLEALTRASQAIASATLVQRMVTDLRYVLVKHLLKLKASFHDKNLSGALVTRSTSDFDNIGESLATGVLNSFVDFAVLTTAIIAMFSLNWKLALICICILPLVAFIVQFSSRALKRAMLAARKKLAELNAFTQEVLFGHQTIKLLSAHDHTTNRHDQMARQFESRQMHGVSIDAILFSLLDGIASVTLGCVLYLAVILTTEASLVTAGTLVAFVRLIQQMFDPLKQLGSTMTMLQGVFTSCERIFQLLDTREFIEGDQNPTLPEGKLVFSQVEFRYQPDPKDPPILDQLSFEIPPYTSMAIVGRTGSGKSTIAKLISKSYDNYSGSITLDGHELRNIDPDFLKKEVSVVPQDVVLFDASIKENVRLFNPDIDDETVWNALGLVGAREFVEKLSGGIDHELMNQGSSLSQGQRQLIAFSRALCASPKLIILDEATSSVDPASEAMIQKAIERIIAGRTIIVIAHRLETIKNCDQILVLENGQLQESGTHQQLLKNQGAYSRYLADAQVS